MKYFGWLLEETKWDKDLPRKTNKKTNTQDEYGWEKKKKAQQKRELRRVIRKMWEK